MFRLKIHIICIEHRNMGVFPLVPLFPGFCMSISSYLKVVLGAAAPEKVFRNNISIQGLPYFGGVATIKNVIH